MAVSGAPDQHQGQVQAAPNETELTRICEARHRWSASSRRPRPDL